MWLHGIKFVCEWERGGGGTGAPRASYILFNLSSPRPGIHVATLPTRFPSGVPRPRPPRGDSLYRPVELLHVWLPAHGFTLLLVRPYSTALSSPARLPPSLCTYVPRV